MPINDMQMVQAFLIAWSVAVAFALALGATYSVFRSASLRRDAAARRGWSDFYLVADGRTTRRGLWLGFVTPVLLGIILPLFLWESPFEIPVATLALIGISLWPAIAIGAKRCHDRAKSGWFLLIFLIPVLGALWLLIELGLLRGTSGPNRFGPDPLVSTG
jgi:uncharacterized membrane protein YhaH (DUF805 family)